jgi:Cu-Zn family superoxide dismutase
MSPSAVRLLTIAAALGGVALAPQPDPASAQRPTSYVIPGGRVFPEGVAVRPGTRDFFVTGTTDGAVYRGSTDRRRMRVFLPGGRDGRTAAVGIKADRAGRLFVAGGATGRMYVYDARTGRLVRAFDTGVRAPETFVNDVALARGGAYFTDSRRPVLYRVNASAGPSGAVATPPEIYLDLTQTPVQYGDGNNLNGIAPVADGRYLLTVQSNTGRLFRVEVGTRRVVEVDLGGVRLTSGDGLLVVGRTLYVVRNRFGQIVKVAMSRDFASGRVLGARTHRSFRFPTTIAATGDSLLVVNAQFDARNEMRPPALPFTVSRIPRP